MVKKLPLYIVSFFLKISRILTVCYCTIKYWQNVYKIHAVNKPPQCVTLVEFCHRTLWSSSVDHPFLSKLFCIFHVTIRLYWKVPYLTPQLASLTFLLPHTLTTPTPQSKQSHPIFVPQTDHTNPTEWSIGPRKETSSPSFYPADWPPRPRRWPLSPQLYPADWSISPADGQSIPHFIPQIKCPEPAEWPTVHRRWSISP